VSALKTEPVQNVDIAVAYRGVTERGYTGFPVR
jgi:hypothetical protein